MRTILFLAIVFVAVQARAADDPGAAGMASVYLQYCPEVRAGPKLLADVDLIAAREGDDLEAFNAARNIALADVRQMTVQALCNEAVSIFGENGRRKRGYVLEKPDNGTAALDLLAEGDVRLPGQDLGEEVIAAAYVIFAHQNCKTMTFSSGFAYYLEKSGYSINDLTGIGRLARPLKLAMLEIVRWQEWQAIISTSNATERVCGIAWERYGPEGTALVDLVKRK